MSFKTLWYHRTTRLILFQAILVLLVLWGISSMLLNLQANLEQRGVTSGFGFLDDRAGFGIIMSLIPYDQSDTYARAFWVGVLNTLYVSFVGIIFATILGFIVGVARLSQNWLVRKLAACFVETLRNIPLLLQIFFWYFAVLRSLPAPRESFTLFDQIIFNNRGIYVPIFSDPMHFWIPFYTIIVLGCLYLLGHKWQAQQNQKGGQQKSFMPWIVVISLLVFGGEGLWIYQHAAIETPTLQAFNYAGGAVLIPEFIALLLALSLYTAAFIAEIVRLGILSVPRGQIEAAYSLGLKHKQVLKEIIIPQMMRVILPPLTNQYLNLTKNSSLATAIAYPDLVSVFAGTVLNQTGQAVEVIGITMAVYLFISLSISGIMQLYERTTAWGRL